MLPPSGSRVITRERYDALLFDLDGVIADTASLHARCWKQMFDDYLQTRATQRDEVFRPFDIAMDCRLYVDGKPRFDGVRDFLTSRGIQLPERAPDDPSQTETLYGLGNRKNDLINEVIKDIGGEGLRGKRQLYPSNPPSGIQNRRCHLESKLHNRPSLRRVRWLLRRAG